MVNDNTVKSVMENMTEKGKATRGTYKKYLTDKKEQISKHAEW